MLNNNCFCYNLIIWVIDYQFVSYLLRFIHIRCFLLSLDLYFARRFYIRLQLSLSQEQLASVPIFWVIIVLLYSFSLRNWIEELIFFLIF